MRIPNRRATNALPSRTTARRHQRPPAAWAKDVAALAPGLSAEHGPPEAISICSELARRVHNDLGYERAVAITFVGPASAGAMADDDGRSVILFDGERTDAPDHGYLQDRSAISEACRSLEPVVCRSSRHAVESVIDILLPEAEEVVVVPISSHGACLGYTLAERHRSSRHLDDPASRALIRSVSAAGLALADLRSQSELEAAVDTDQVPHLAGPATNGDEDSPLDERGPLIPAATDHEPRSRTLLWTPRAAIDVLLAATLVLAPVLAATGPVAVAAVVGFPAVLLAPGAALMGFFTFDDLGDEVMLILVTSITIAVVGAQVMLGLGLWHPVTFAALVALTAVLLIRHAIHSATLPRGTSHLAIDAPTRS